MRSVCMLHFKRDIQVARFLVLLLMDWQRLGTCLVPKASENLE